MAKINQAGVAFESKVFVGTAHTSVNALTEATIKTFIDTATTTSTNEVVGVGALTGFGVTPNNVTANVLGEPQGRNYKGQPNPPTLTFSLEANPSDPGQAQILVAASVVKGLVLEIVASDGGKRYKACNVQFDFLENVDPTSAYTYDITAPVQDFINTQDDTA